MVLELDRLLLDPGDKDKPERPSMPKLWSQSAHDMPAGPPPMMGTIGAPDSVDRGISRLRLRAAPWFATVGPPGH